MARVIARPPFLYLACLLLGLVLDRVLPLPFILPEVALIRWTVGGGLILIGWGNAVSLTALYPLGALALILWLLPETKGRQLE